MGIYAKTFLKEPVNLRKRKGGYKGVLDGRKGSGGNVVIIL